ncbi:PSD1 and planctomycete cytochrome C domain-containing protein [Prosthecobacter sp. SYSU 5D2]|uniref:PSD1 and planctomycete cytochrome C domain-containing protein n=1 Tax=Prosthecobacter sp. SYSU 5D2 TaxID=3134134 RepID=UPI0031FF05E6
MLRSFILLSTLTLPAAAAVDFVADIQPIFEERCYSCHGGSKQEAAFRLDHKPSALKGGDFGTAIKPGHSSDSILVHAIEGRDPKMRMPRKGDPLSAEEITKIKAWIDAGAEWPDSASVMLETNINHWAFKAPVKPPLPAEAHPVDAFIQQRLANEGLKPAPEAAPETLIRRLYLDLVGLPPTPEEVAAFVRDFKATPKAYESLVEKLLASPHYGERWGRHWLDAARYADSNGYEKDPMRHIWFYRDWVINAFNRDLPYDQFIIEQLAGDQLPKATQDQIVATGFLRNSMINEEGGVDPEQFRMEAMFDRMDTIGKSILGLTIGCTQCHNHKYDPISQEEYFQMFAFLNNDNEPWRVVYTSSEQMQRAKILQRIQELEDKLKHETPDWPQRLKNWAASLKGNQPKWTTLQFEDDPSGGEKAIRQKDGSILAQGYAPTKSHVKFVVKLQKDTPKKITAFRLELLNDPNLPAYGPGRSIQGLAALTEFTAEVKTGDKLTPLKFIKATADHGEPENTPLAEYARDKDTDKDKRVTGPVTYAIDGDAKTAWGINAGPGRRNVPRKAVFVLETPLELAADTELTVGLSMKHGGWNSDDLQTMNLGRYRISATDAPDAEADPLPASVRAWVEKGSHQGDAMNAEEGLRAPFAHFRSTIAEWKPVNDEIEALWKQHPEGTTSLVLDSREEPRMTHLLKRGDFLKPGDRVTTGVPAMLNNPLPKDADGSRLTLAKWMVSRESPTTARAWVNRVWQAYFGTGLVETPEDFGIQGSLPSHPELLDWLAAEFMDKGWSNKELHRLLVTSATYRQDSRMTPALLEKDPYNRLLARGPRFRVEGEVVRDIQLAVSGLLNPQLGGRSVMPPAPQYLFEKPVSYAPFPWKVEGDDQKYRRSVYVFRRRSTPFPFLGTFDVPTGETACVKRSRSNTPLQALMTLNETLSMEAAQHLARRMEEAGAGDDAKAIAHGFSLCTSRQPTDTEADLLTGLLQRQRSSRTPEDAPPMVIVARVLLNLDETITKE